MLNTKDIADLQFQSNQLGDPIKDLWYYQKKFSKFFFFFSTREYIIQYSIIPAPTMCIDVLQRSGGKMEINEQFFDLLRFSVPGL